VKGKKPLALVMPVYNEGECIAESVSGWLNILGQLHLDFDFLVFDDGSTDGTYKALMRFEKDERVRVIRHSNRGHGPTILSGYLLACDNAEWVFQTDSDMEIPAIHFLEFWRQKTGYDAVFGVRANRRQGIVRKAISAISRSSVRCLYAAGVRDVNVPYRLIRSEVLKVILADLPADSFAPNTIISGALSLNGARILNIPVSFTERKTGSTSLVSFRLCRGVFQSFLQLISFRCRHKALPFSSRDQ
jgi:dolichol-phosphate mannosyltransferase